MFVKQKQCKHKKRIPGRQKFEIVGLQAPVQTHPSSPAVVVAAKNIYLKNDKNNNYKFYFHDLGVLFQPLFLNYIKHISSTFAKPALSRTRYDSNK